MVNGAVVTQNLACGALFAKDEHVSDGRSGIVPDAPQLQFSACCWHPGQSQAQRQVDDCARCNVEPTTAALIAWSVCGQVPAARVMLEAHIGHQCLMWFRQAAPAEPPWPQPLGVGFGRPALPRGCGLALAVWGSAPPATRNIACGRNHGKAAIVIALRRHLHLGGSRIQARISATCALVHHAGCCPERVSVAPQ